MTTTRPLLFLPGQHAFPDGQVDLVGIVMHHVFRRDFTKGGRP